MKHAIKDGWLDVSPLADIEPIKAKHADDKKPRFLSDAESTRLYNAMRERDADQRASRASGNKHRRINSHELLPDYPEHFVDHLEPMIIVSLKTGLRQRELFTLLWSDIELDFSSLNIRKEVAKSGRPRDVPIPRSAQDVLRRWREQTTSNRLVFDCGNGTPFDNVKKSWKSLLTRADINDFRWHDLRHDYASQLVINGVSIEKVSALLGHADIKTTQIYAHLSNDSLRQAVSVLD